MRALVEFTLHGEDIRPCGSIADRMEGQLGHRARQKLLGEEWQTEVPLTLENEVDEELVLRVSGRMDAFREGFPPIIEEIKLCGEKTAPERPYPAHLAQAVCYGHMLCVSERRDEVMIRIAYVTPAGKAVRVFDGLHTAEMCRARFEDLLIPYIHRLLLVRKHQRERDASVRALAFPFPSWRPGQYEMAGQVYTAIRRGRRLFASMPTGCGKSAATLFPALKALSMGLTNQVYYLTARTTQRQGPSEALARLRRQPLHLWSLTLNAKEKQCPECLVCHPDWCPRAKGHYLRDSEAIEEMMKTDDWSPEVIRAMADRFNLCPFEFSLSLAELADLVVCDYNYALHPTVHIRRVFDRTSRVTLLVDEAHHLDDRVRDMLGGVIDTARIRRLRTVVGKHGGRKHPLYKAMTSLIRAMEEVEVPPEKYGGKLLSLPRAIDAAAEDFVIAILAAQNERFPWDEVGEKSADILADTLGFVRARRRDPDEYALICQGSEKNPRLTVYPLRVAPYLKETTAGMSGVVCFSATLEPLREMRVILGGEEDDACFAMPSPFPRENLLVIRERVNTRYPARGASAPVIAEQIRQLQAIHPGHYLVFFPSFAYLQETTKYLEDFPCQIQRGGMTDTERQEFLSAYGENTPPVISLCVLGGIFSEGIDLPGKALEGVIVVGVGLPQVNIFRETLREEYDRENGQGFRYAYRIPGMQKVAQAAGRVIRTERDRGVVILMDDRYWEREYIDLCPAHWILRNGDSVGMMTEFWNNGVNE